MNRMSIDEDEKGIVDRGYSVAKTQMEVEGQESKSEVGLGSD